MAALSDTAIFDLDGTLVDSNYQHAIAWYRAFRAHDLTPALWRIHRAIGMGGDRLVAAVCDDEVEARHGDNLRAAWAAEFDRLIDEVAVMAGARELLRAVSERGLQVVLASSGRLEHVQHYLGLLDVDDVLAATTSAEDAESTKPAPDLLAVALDKVGASDGVAVGDSTWDFLAAGKLGLRGIAVRTGGFGVEELRAAGADLVFASLPELTDQLSRTALHGRA